MPGGGGNDLKFWEPDWGGKKFGMPERGPIIPGGIIEPWPGKPLSPGGILPMFSPGGTCIPGGIPIGGIGELGCP